MKKSILIFALIIATITTKAQGTTCGTATALPLHNSSTAQTVNTTEQWFSFVADSNSVSIGIENTGASPTSYVTAAGVHKGNCGSLTLVNSDIINPYSNIVFFVAKNLTAGTTYYLQIKRTPPTFPAVLSVNTYNLIVQHMVTYPEVCGYSPSDNSNFSNNIFTPANTALDGAIRNYIYPSNQSIPAGPKIIPVVVHVIHNANTLGTGNNITYNQIRWQIAAMNAALSANYAMYDINKTPGSAAVDTRIRLCLAQSITNLGPTSWTTASEPGVMRYNTSITGALYPKIKNLSADYTTIVNLTRNNNNPAWFPYNKVLNIWTVPGFDGAYTPPGLVGVFVDNMPDPSSTPAGTNIDGIICRSECFGDITYNQAGCPSNMLMNTYLNHGTAMVHELGHYLGLYHTFEGKTPCLGKNLYNASTDDCSLEGDQVCDTPPCTLISGAPISYNGGPVSAVCGAPEMVENYMSYSYDIYMNTFTLYQALRMQAMLNVVPMRKDLWQTLNLASVGVSTSGQTFLTAAFKFSPQLACAGADVQFSTPGGYDFSATTWNWNFGDGTQSPLQNPIHKFPSNGTYTVTLTASFGGQSTTCSGTINIGPTATLLTPGSADVCDGTNAVVRVRFANATPPYNLSFSNGSQTFTFNNVSVNPGRDKDFFIPVTSAANTITILSFSDANCNGAFSGSNVFTVRTCCRELAVNGNFSQGNTAFSSQLNVNTTANVGAIHNTYVIEPTSITFPQVTTLGNSMRIDGPCNGTQGCPANQTGVSPWSIFSQTILTTPVAGSYLFSFDAAANGGSPPLILFRNGTNVQSHAGDPPLLLRATITFGTTNQVVQTFQIDQNILSNFFVWNHFVIRFNSIPPYGPININIEQITNLNGSPFDFYLDNISLRFISTTPPTITANITNSNQCTAPCNGSATVSASGTTGPYTFSWSSGTLGATATALCPNTYTVSVSDNNACVNATLVTVNGSISASVTPAAPSICKGGLSSVTATGTGGTTPYTYSWSTGATTAGISVTPVVTTIYTVTVTDNRGCNRTATSVVNIRFAPTVAPTSSSGCVGANTLTAAVTSGTSPYTYTWSTGAATSVINVSPIAQTTYTVTVRDTYGCSSASTLSIVNCCAGSTIMLANKTIGPIAYTTSTISMGGTITISGAVTLNGCNVLMYNDAIIKVPNGASLNIIGGSWLRACTNMWKGIIVEPGGNLTVNGNSKIEDAKTAVQSVNGAMFNITASTLNKNYINLDLLSYNGTHPGILKNAVISCVAGGSPTLLIAPYATRKTLLGVNIAGVSKVTIGSPAAAGDLITFNNLARGIYETDGGTLNVYNCSFNNITPSGMGYGECITSGYGGTTPGPGNIKTLNVGGTGLMVNTFTNSTTGVLVANDHNTSILSNNFNNLTTGIKIQNFIGWASSTVNSNTITDCTTGVYGYNIQGCAPFEVGSNQINIPVAGANSKPNSTGVRIANTVPNVDLPVCFNIHDNTIKRTSNGIWITNANSADIGNNHISAVSNLGSGSGVLQDGILVEASSVGSIHHNDVDGGDMNAWWMSGVRHENSANLVKGNTVQNIGRGLFFGGNCSGIIPAQNHMKNNFDGFFLNYATGLPAQLNANGEATEDTWDGTFVRSHTWAYNTIASVCTLNLKLPRCNPASGPCKDPFPFVRGNDPGGFASDNILYAEVTTSSTKKTADPKRELYLNLAKDKIKFPVYDASAKWMCKYNVYCNLMAADSAYKTDEPELKLFADSVSGLNIGKVYNLNKLFAQSNYNTTAAQAAVNSLLAVNLVEQNLKDVYAINIANRNNNSLSKTEIKALQAIAKQCPYEGGYGVYNARVLLSTVDNTVYTNSCESGMADKSGLKLAPGGVDTTGVYPGISIYPNPANDKLNAVIHLAEGQTGTLTVYDLAGKSVLSSMLVGNNITEISTAHLNTGIYIYKVNINDAPVNAGKLSIIR